MKILHPRIENGVFFRRQFILIKGRGAPHQLLPFRERQLWDFFEDFGETHAGSVSSGDRSFNSGLLNRRGRDADSSCMVPVG